MYDMSSLQEHSQRCHYNFRMSTYVLVLLSLLFRLIVVQTLDFKF